MKKLILPILVLAAIAIIGGVYRLSNAQNAARQMQRAQQTYRDIVDHIWPSDPEARLGHLQQRMFHEPIARSTPEVIARCLSLTHEAMSAVEFAPDRIPGFTFACLATGVTASLSAGNLTIAVELTAKTEEARNIMRREAGVEMKTAHERCMRRAASDYESGVDAILTSYTVCLRGVIYSSLKLTESKLIELFPPNERAAFDSDTEETMTLFRSAIPEAENERGVSNSRQSAESKPN